MSSYFIILPFFYWYCVNRVLPSFPTRRSSDLLTFNFNTFYSVTKVTAISTDNQIVAAHRRHAWRSEEHTSELQSHHDLVCRLLLEKKHKHTTTGPPQRQWRA